MHYICRAYTYIHMHCPAKNHRTCLHQPRVKQVYVATCSYSMIFTETDHLLAVCIICMDTLGATLGVSLFVGVPQKNGSKRSGLASE